MSTLAEPEGTALLVLVNFHRFLNSPEIVQSLARQITAGKQNRTFVVILAPVVQIPVELEKLFVCLEHDLPSREQLQEIAGGIADKPGELPDGAGLESLLDAAAGLTRYEAEGRVQPVDRAARSPGAGDDLGAQVPDAQEERPACNCTAEGNGSLTWADWRRSKTSVGGPCADARKPILRPGRGAFCCYRLRAVASRPCRKPWAMNSAGRRSFSTSAR